MSRTPSSIALLVSLATLACAAPQPAPAHPFEVVALEHAAAREMAGILQRALASTNGQEAQVVADVRSNSLILRASPEELLHLRGLITRLDHQIE